MPEELVFCTARSTHLVAKQRCLGAAIAAVVHGQRNTAFPRWKKPAVRSYAVLALSSFLTQHPEK